MGSWKFLLLYFIIPTFEANVRFMKSWKYKLWVASYQNPYSPVWVSIRDIHVRRDATRAPVQPPAPKEGQHCTQIKLLRTLIHYLG